MDKKYEALKLDNQLCFPLYAAAREVVNNYHPYLSKLDITYTQYIALMVMWEREKISAKELGEKLHLDSGTLTPLLKSLEKKGYVTRRRSEEDERFLIVELTDEGRNLKDEAADIPMKVSGCIKLDPKDAADLYRILYEILNQSK